MLKRTLLGCLIGVKIAALAILGMGMTGEEAVADDPCFPDQCCWTASCEEEES